MRHSNDDRTSSSTPVRGGRRSRRAGVALVLTLALGLVAWGDPPAVVEAARPAATPEATFEPWPVPGVTGPASGVAAAPDGTLVVVDRGGAPFASATPVSHDVVHRVDPRTGAVVDSWGRGLLASPHGVDVAPDGTVWITDVGTDEVVAFSPGGDELRRFGTPPGRLREACLQVRNVLTNLPCPAVGLAFGRPTDVAVQADGTLYVADGYRGSRVVHLDVDGAVISEVGELGSGTGDFFLPHGVEITGDGRVAVAERRNSRVQLLDADLSSAAVVDAPVGRPYDVVTGPDGDLFVLDGADGLDGGDPGASSVVRLDPDATEVLAVYALPEPAAGHQLAVTDAGLVVASLDGAPLWRLPLPEGG